MTNIDIFNLRVHPHPVKLKSKLLIGSSPNFTDIKKKEEEKIHNFSKCFKCRFFDEILTLGRSKKNLEGKFKNPASRSLE